MGSYCINLFILLFRLHCKYSEVLEAKKSVKMFLREVLIHLTENELHILYVHVQYIVVIYWDNLQGPVLCVQ